jgi:hypothetical protein
VFVYTYDDKGICLANLGKYDEAWNNKVALDKLRSKEKKQRNINISSDITSDMQLETSLMINRNYDRFERCIRS